MAPRTQNWMKQCRDAFDYFQVNCGMPGYNCMAKKEMAICNWLNNKIKKHKKGTLLHPEQKQLFER